MGLGLHGGALGTIEWLVQQGARITVTDLKTQEQLKTSVEKLAPYPDIQLVLGQHRTEDFTGADLVIRNPAVPRNSEHLQAAREAGVPIEMDSSLFFQHAPTQDIIGITGSKGKTTTAHAIATVLTAHDGRTVSVGVDGISPLGAVENVQPNVPVVFELSSWRLEALDEHKISPRTAVVTSIYRDHLNTYKSFAEYIETKKTIIRHQSATDIAILNFDDQEVKTWAGEAIGHVYAYTLGKLPIDGIGIADGVVTIQVRGETTVICSLADLPARFDHERRNLLPAILIGHLRGMSVQEIRDALQNIQPLPHRLEVVRELDGVTYVNDSAATMPDATIAALQAFKDKPLILILGGSDKKLEFSELGNNIAAATNIKALVWLPGTATKTMQAAVPNQARGLVWEEGESMEAAVQKARSIAQAGDTVLLSPGATSFGLFQHEFDRGEKFKDCVHNL